MILAGWKELNWETFNKIPPRGGCCTTTENTEGSLER